MALFQSLNYREFLKEQIRSRPSKGHGVMLKMAQKIGVHPSVLSQVFQEKRDLTPEQAEAIAQFFELGNKETQHFLLLVHHARAGTPGLRKLLEKQLAESRAMQQQVAKRVRPSGELTLDEKAVFYSSWHYSALRLLSSVPALQPKEALRKRLRLSRSRFQGSLEYLKKIGLCQEENGLITSNLGSTHLDGTSPLVNPHHANWRVKAIERHPEMSLENELAFSCPMALSKVAAAKVREKLLAVIEEACAEADPSPSETVYFLNVDWLEI